jgi:hypothetical protein
LRPLSVNDRHAYDRSNAFDFIQQPRAGVALRSVRMSTQTRVCADACQNGWRPRVIDGAG